MEDRKRPWLEVPPIVTDAYSAWRWTLVDQTPLHSVVYRLEGDDGRRIFLKLSPEHHHPSLSEEGARMRWARRWLPVPDVIDCGSSEATSWLVTASLPGVDGTHPDLLRQPTRLVWILARGLRALHEAAPVEGCPFDFRLDAALAHARRRLEAGEIDRERDFHPEFSHLLPAEALERLERLRPPTEDLVVCHGDYCPPNILIEGDGVSGYVDLGELGVSDRWRDLAVATWSMTWNLGPGHAERFLDEYGIEADAERLAYYRLLYDVVA